MSRLKAEVASRRHGKLKSLPILLALALVLSFGIVALPMAGTVEADEGNTLEVSKWTEDVGNPIFDPEAKAYYPTVVYDVSQFSGRGDTAYYKMWFGSNSGVGYAYSDDGIDWTEGANPVTVLTNANHPLVEYYADGFTGCNSGANPNSDTMHYRIWYWDTGQLYSVSAIRYAESPDGTTWSNDQPLTGNIITGGNADWNRGSYGPIDVLYNSTATNTGDSPFDYSFAMYFDGTTGAFEEIGLGYSSDGINWELYGKVLPRGNDGDWGNTDDWDSSYTTFGTIIKEADGKWHMWYSGGQVDSNDGIGYAHSSDGLNWVRSPNNPIMHQNDGVAWRANRTYTPVVIEDGGIYKMWFSGKDTATGNYAIGYATAEGPFPSIQSAIDAATTGDTINVAAGTYTEALTITDKGLTITGASESGVIVQTQADWTTKPTNNVFTINATGKTVTIQTMTIRNGDYGIRSTAGNVNVLHTTVYHNGWDGTGVPDTPTQENMGTFYTTYATDGGAIRIENSAASEVAYCTVYENDRGIRYQYGSNGNFHHNSSYNNIQSGIYLTDHGAPGGCTDTQVHDNTVYGNMNNGILVLRGNSNSITDNNVYDNWNTGIHMHGPSDFTVEGNAVTNNSLYAFNGEGNPGNSDGGIAAAGAETIAATAYTLKILGNTVSNNNAGSHANSTGIWVGTGLPSDGITVEGNTFSSHDIDIDIDSQAATLSVNYNDFDGTGTGVRNNDTGANVDATNNWWGDIGGPSHDSVTAGDGVSANVEFSSWLGDTIDKTPMTFIVDDVGPEPAAGYIQTAVDAALAGDTISVAAGTYNEDVTINKSLTLVSAEGKDNTTINGQSTGEAGAVRIAADNVVLGGDGTGFTVNGAGVAAVYFTQPVSGCLVEGNGIVAANTKNALLFGGGQSSHTIRGNTFQGDASQLVYVNGQPSVGNASTSVNFIGNTFSGTATGPALGQEAADSIINGNTFATVTGYASLELWVNNTVTGNNFTADLPAGGVYVLDNTGFGPGIPGGGNYVLDIDAVLSNNTFLRAVVVEHPGSSRLPKIWANIQDAVNEAVSGDTINVAAGTYDLTAPIDVDKSLTITGDTITPSNVTVDAGTITGDDRDGFQVKASDVTIQGFKVQGALDTLRGQNNGVTIGNWWDGAAIVGLQNIVISYNEITNCSKGISVYRAQHVTISHNKIHDCPTGTEKPGSWPGKGIMLYGKGPSDGIQNNDIDILNNEIYNNGLFGIELNHWETTGTAWVEVDVLIDGNTIYNNGGPFDAVGYAVDCGRGISANGWETGVTITNNEVYGHWSTSGARFHHTAAGIRANNSKGFVISNNNVHDNMRGIYIYGSETTRGGENTGFVVTGNDVYDNAQGIVFGSGDVGYAHFNNIYGNNVTTYISDGVSPYGAVNLGTGTFDAENNWWGKKGKGAIKKMVSGSVDYDPWTGAGVANAKSKKTGTDKATVNAKTEADTEVDKSGKGKPTITVAKYEDNPGRGFSGDIGKYIDVHIDDPTDVDELVIKLYYTDAEIAGLTESSLRLRWWDGDSWELCSDSGVNTAENYMWAKVRADTTPSLSQLKGTPFAGRGTSAPVEVAPVEVADVGPELIYLRVDFLGEISKMRLGDNNRLRDTLIALSPDGRLSLEIEEGTLALVDGKRIYLIEIREAEECPPLPEDTIVAGKVYDITPSGATFDKDVILILSFNPMELPENTVSVTMAYYVSDEGWVELESEQGGVAELGTMTATVSHFTPFAILAKLAPPAPPPVPAPPPTLPAAHFVASGLTIEPSVRGIWEPITFVTKAGESVTITANVANDGGQEGTYIVELKINGETVDSKEVTLAAGQSQRVSFTLSGMDYGRYEVEVAGLSGEFAASRIINWWLIIGIIAAIGLITWGVIRGRRRVYS